MRFIIISAYYHFQIAAVALQIFQHHHIDIDGAVVVLQNGNALVLAEKIRGIAADKGCFAGSQKSGNQVCFYQVRVLSIL